MRTAGLLFIVFGLVVFTSDLVRLFERGVFTSTPLGTIWFLIDPYTLNLAQAFIERDVAIWLWQDVIGEVLAFPAWAVLPGIGFVLLMINRMNEAEKVRRAVF